MKNMTNRIVQTHKGEHNLVEEGTHDSLLTLGGTYAHLYSKQFE